MKYGLSDQQRKEITDILTSYKAVEKAILFGSRAIDTYKEASDVDIAIKGQNADWSLAMTIQDHLEEETYLPFFFDVVAYGSVESEELRRHIDGKGKVLFCRGVSEELMENGELIVENGGSAWRKKPLKEVAQLRRDSWKVGQEPLPYIALEHIVEGGLRIQGIGNSATIASNKYRFNSDSFLFGKLRPYFRKLYKPDFDGVCSTDIWVVEPKDGNSKDYLFYFFANQDFIDLSYSGSSGTRMPRADWKFISEQKWDFPPLPEQKAIAEVLSALDDKIDLLHRQNKTLEQMAETLFRQWFVVEAGEDWEYEEILNYVSVVDNRGKTPPNTNNKTLFPLIEVNALGKDNRLVDYSVIRKYVDEDAFNSWFRNKPKKYDTLLSTVGSIGAISMYLLEEGNVAQNVIGLSAKNISPLYLFQALKYKSGEILQLDIGGVQPSIKVPHLLSLIIPIPPIAMQKTFDSQVIEFVSKMERNYKQIRTLQSLRDTLLPKLMSGEVRVTQ